eukprot:Rhum_TRINITY_DN14737_c20_g2::Rhum_TRINITY_DN14737_c20_g2_i1::g.113737::m.113737
MEVDGVGCSELDDSDVDSDDLELQSMEEGLEKDVRVQMAAAMKIQRNVREWLQKGGPVVPTASLLGTLTASAAGASAAAAAASVSPVQGSMGAASASSAGGGGGGGG